MPAMKDIKGPKQPQSARRMWHLLKRRWSPILTMQILGVHSGPPLWLRCVDLLEVKANLTCSAKMANTNRRFSPHICAVLLRTFLKLRSMYAESERNGQSPETCRSANVNLPRLAKRSITPLCNKSLDSSATKARRLWKTYSRLPVYINLGMAAKRNLEVSECPS